jgi:hypothetical protein
MTEHSITGTDEPMLIPTDFESVLQYTLGTIDVVRTLCAVLIGQGVVLPDTFQDDFQRMADHWAKQGDVIRREPSASLVRALKDMERVKRGMPAHLVNPSSISTKRN